MAVVKFINHSSLVVEDKRTKILCDPWFKGLAFQDGWSLLFDKSHDINKIDFDYIWISHEHPDHFSIPTLSSLTKPTKFIYQETKDNKVKNFLENKGHEVVILQDSIPKKIGDIELTIFVCDGYDSSLLFEFSDGKQFLNINDARIDLPDELTRVKKRIKNLDMAAVQFSYANWAGNDGDKEIASHQQELVDLKNLKICKELSPNKLLLFASFVYYCHEENFFWNNNFWFAHVLQSLRYKDTQLILPKPNQEFIVGDSLTELDEKNSESLKFWTNLHKNTNIIKKTESLDSIKELEEIYQQFYKDLWDINSLASCKTSSNEDFTLLIEIKDFNITIELGLFKEKFKKVEKEPDCRMSSETFFFMLKNRFSRGTVSVNSRVSFNYRTAYKFFIFFFISYANNIGNYFSDAQLSRDQLEKIKNTSILTSIFKFHPDCELRFNNTLLNFIE
jgi:hypothetical protein